MPDNISSTDYIATHLAAAICSTSLKTSDVKAESLTYIAKDAVKIYDAVHNALVDRATQIQNS